MEEVALVLVFEEGIGFRNVDMGAVTYQEHFQQNCIVWKVKGI